jgi:hypothetical protein
MLFRESGSRKFKKGLDVVLVRIERSQRGQIGGACAPFRNKVRSRAPGELGLPVSYGNYVRNHARVPAVSVCERMDFRNKLVMKSNHAFVDWECLMIEPIFRVRPAAAAFRAPFFAKSWAFAQILTGSTAREGKRCITFI